MSSTTVGTGMIPRSLVSERALVKWSTCGPATAQKSLEDWKIRLAR